MRQSIQTDEPPKATPVTATPEFADAKGVRQLYGLTRSYLYNLSDAGQIRSVCIRRRGAIRGKRLFDCASIRAFLERHIEPPKRDRAVTNIPNGTFPSTPGALP